MVSHHTTSEIPSSGGSDGHSLENNTLIVVLGASGDLAKKKVSSPPNDHPSGERNGGLSPTRLIDPPAPDRISLDLSRSSVEEEGTGGNGS